MGFRFLTQKFLFLSNFKILWKTKRQNRDFRVNCTVCKVGNFGQFNSRSVFHMYIWEMNTYLRGLL